MKIHQVGERLLTVDKVNVIYGTNHVLRDCSFHVDNIIRPGMEQGQVVALLGPSGIGKTQLFRCIAGLQKPTSGSVALINKPTISAGDVGVVLQHYPLLAHRTVLSNLLKTGSEEKTATALLEQVGLAALAKKYPADLSGGQRQRIAILQQLLCNQHFMLMDEPFSGLDLIAKRNICKLIRDISVAHEHNTNIVITHDIDTAVTIADTILVLGRDRDTAGNIIPGARIKHTINLIERGIAWEQDPEHHPEFPKVVTELKDLFTLL